MEWIRITSRQNETVKTAAALSEKKKREEAGVFAAEGVTILEEAVRDSFFPQAVFAAERAASRLAPLLSDLPPSVRCYLLPDAVFEKITAEKGSEGVVSLFPLSSPKGAPDLKGGSFFLALESLQDPGNVGTVLRTAAALGCDGVVLCGCADPFSPKCVRASMGAVFRIPFLTCRNGEEALALFEKNGAESSAMALEENAVPLSRASFDGKKVFWIGNEGHGLSETVLAACRQTVVIPMKGMESLNAAVAASLVLWERARRKGEV